MDKVDDFEDFDLDLAENTLHIEITGDVASCLRIQELLENHGWASIGDCGAFYHDNGLITRDFNVEALPSGQASVVDVTSPDAEPAGEATEIDDEYYEDDLLINETIFEEVFPILNDLDEAYPDHSAFFSVFINSMHVLFYQGWTRDDLVREVLSHYLLFLQDEFADLEPHELQ